MFSINNKIDILSYYLSPIARIFIAIIFLMSGLNKIGNYGNTAYWMEAVGVPSLFLPIVIALEIVGGLAIILGWKARIFSFLLAGFCMLSAIVFHSNFADQNEMINFMKNIAIAGGFLTITINGAGSFSLDGRLSQQ
jgi:putative oxidoreductase